MTVRKNTFTLLACAAVALINNGASAFVSPALPSSVMARQQQKLLQPANLISSSTSDNKFEFNWQRSMAETDSSDEVKTNNLPMLLDPGTKGGALFLALIAFIVPILFYELVTQVFGFDGLEAGRWIGGGFTVVATMAWVSTYIFRVATKDMTYAKQLKDYENAVIAKRLEELDEDELQALVEEVERDEF